MAWLSISEHAASNKVASMLFAAALIITGSLFCLFVLGWLIPRMGLGISFGCLYVASFAMQLLTSWVPAPGLARQGSLTFAAYSMAVLCAPLTLVIIIAAHITTVARPSICCVLATC